MSAVTTPARAEAAPIRTQAIGLLAAGLAHDLNNMLAAVIATAELVAERLPAGGTRADVDSIIDQASRASRLIRQLLAFSRQEMLQPQRTDLARILDDLRQILGALAGRGIAVDIVHGPPATVTIDPTAFERILVNLVLNARDAIHAAGSGGRIRITSGSVGPADLPAAGRAFMPPASYVCVTVEDDGPGISDDVAPRIFEPYFTTRPDGQGLGLSSAFGLVKQSGGFLLHDRGALGGARFSIYLPETPERQGAHPPPRQASGRMILLADDEMLLRMSAARGLERLGFRVRQAADGEAALARLEEERPALLLSDIRMPGMDGVELARRARLRHPGLPVLLISGYADQQARADIPGMQVGFLEKPFTMKGLEKAVQALL